MNKLIIIDGNAIVHRAYHALPPMTTKKGQMVNAVYGFASMLLKVWRDLKPDYIAVTFDMAGPTFRHKKYDKYKATRVRADQELYDQIPLAHSLVTALNIPIYEKQGYEADDVIGTIVKKIKEKNLETYIVTGDMDTLQLIRPGVNVFTLRKGMSDTVIYDAKKVEERFGFGPDKMVDYKALRGDTSDNIPGVPGIGEKTATELIKNFGGINEIYEAIKDKKKLLDKKIKAGVLKKLQEGEDSARMSFELATIDENVPEIDFELDECRIKEFDREKAIKLFQEFEFISLVNRLPGGKNEFAKEEPQAKNKKTKTQIKKKFIEIKNNKEVEDFVKTAIDEGAIAVQAVGGFDKEALLEFAGFVFALEKSCYFIPAKFAEKLATLFSNGELEVVVHDIKKLAKVLLSLKIEIKTQIFDLMLASYLLNPGSRAHDKNSVALKYTGKELKSSNGQNSLFGFNAPEASEELNILLSAKNKLESELESANNLDLLKKIEIPVALILSQMELNGILVDLDELKKLSNHLKSELKKITAKIFEMAGEEFNIGSPAQLRDILFDKMDIPVLGIKKGKTGLSTAAAELEKMRGLHPIIDQIEQWRELTKLQNTYVDVLPELVNPKTGRVHTTFNQAVTATGRLSSSDPNLQNIPIRTELGAKIRKTFVAGPGNVLLSADYSQIELRIVASLAEDKKMIEIFNKGEDIHQATAGAINNVRLDEVTKEMRRAAKEVNFGVLYGMGSYGLSSRTDISQAEAKKFIEKYFAEFSGVKKYLENTILLAKKVGYCETLFGRRRYIPELNASNFQLRSSAERMAVNHPVQGTAADLMKMAMIEVDKQLVGYLKDDLKILLQVHDELVFEVKEELSQEIGNIIKEAMENVIKLRVPIVVEVHVAKNWGDIK